MQGEIASKWCRENLNEAAAEKELRTTRKGTFLVWRGRSPVDLYLSFIDHEGITHHLPIKQLGRLFYLGGERFHSLSELVVHHLTAREHSDSPVKIVNSLKREKLEATHIALVDIPKVPGNPEFCVHRGDLLSEVGRLDDRWLLAKHLPSESLAFFDLTHTSVLSDMDSAPSALPYFHPQLSGDQEQEEMVQRLAEGGRGSFLLRRSRQTAGAYALLVHTGEKIDKFLVEEVKVPPSSPPNNNNNNNSGTTGGSTKTSGSSSACSGWRLSGRVFATISHIVHRYSIRPMQAEARLTRAVLTAPGGRGGGAEEDKEMCQPDCYSTPYTSSSPSTSTAAAAATTTGCSTNQDDHASAVAAVVPESGEKEDERSSERVMVASVAAQYKSREDKEWRRCGVTLYEHAGTAILRIVDAPRGDRHSLILHHTELVCLHESIFAREATVFLAPLQSEPGVFLSFEPLHFHYTWFHLLRRYTVQRRADPCSFSSLASSSSSSSASSNVISYFTGGGGGTERMEMSLLAVHVDKYKGDQLKAETPYRVGLALNGVSVATTAGQLPATTTSVVFDAHFLVMVTSWSCSLQLTLHAAGKSRPTAVSPIINVPCSSMMASSSSSSSTTSSSSTPPTSAVTPSAAATAAAATSPSMSTAAERKTSSSSAPWASAAAAAGGGAAAAAAAAPFAVTATRTRVVVLGREAYAPLLESLFTEVVPIAKWASGRLPQGQRNLLCSLLVSLVWPHSVRALIESTLGQAIEKREERGDILRRDSFASCLITAALRASGKAALETKLAEERPKKEALTEEWLLGLLSEVSCLPSVALVLACVAATVAAHHPTEGSEHVVRRAISAAFILRFANPLILSALPAADGPALARAIQTAANAATMQSYVRDPQQSAGGPAAARLFDLFERVRESAMQTVMVEAYDTAPEQCALLCHLLAAALASCPGGAHSPSTSISFSSSTMTTASMSCSSSNGTTSSVIGSMTSSTSLPMSTVTARDEKETPASEAVMSSSLSTVSSLPSGCVAAAAAPAQQQQPSHPHPELTPFLARMLELHRT